MTRSVITCDLEGRIETFNEGAGQLFGYSPEEVIGKKRVSAFSPGLVVLGHVGTWLRRAVEQGAFETQSVFVRKDGTPFAAEIRITPTFKRGQHIGYCGVTVPRPELAVAEAQPRISLWTRVMAWLVVTRAPFLTATLVPVALGAALVAQRGAAPFPFGLLGLAALGGALLHVAANTFNDYFDWKSGTDQLNTEYFLAFSGGSRSLELGLVTERGLLRLAVSALVGAAAVGALLLASGRWGLLAFGAAGAFSAYFYTAPPLRLSARKGLGELFVGLNFGPLVVAGTVYALTGEVGAADFLAGLPLGLLTTAILWVNEFPDAPSDALTGKNHLVVVLGRARARWGYVALLFLAAAAVILPVALEVLPLGALASLAAAPLAIRAARVVVAHFEDRALAKASAGTIQLQLAAGALLALGVVLDAPVRRLLGG